LNSATVIRSLRFGFGNPAIHRFGTRGFPSHDLSWFGFTDHISFSIAPAVYKSNFNAKWNFINQVIDFNRRYLMRELREQPEGAHLRQNRVKIAKSVLNRG
jgi:hypothetical protein